MPKTKITDRKASRPASGRFKPTAKKRVSAADKRARPVHVRFALHPVTVFALLLIAVFLASWTFQALADTTGTTISATINAPALTDAATIDSPTDGQVFTSSAVTVAGACPDVSYVTLTINDIFAGMQMCAENNTYQIPTNLYDGTNVLKVQDYNLTDQPGPMTSTISVTYGEVLGKSTTAASTLAPLVLTSDFHYQTFTVGEEFDWQVRVAGGTAPHAITIDWGDATDPMTLLYTGDQDFHIRHTYHTAGFYSVKIRDVDAHRATRILQLAALITNPGSSVVPGITASLGGTSGGSSLLTTAGSWLTSARGWLWVAWPSFLVTVLMVFSFWLGERQEYRDIFLRRRVTAPVRVRATGRRR